MNEKKIKRITFDGLDKCGKSTLFNNVYNSILSSPPPTVAVGKCYASKSPTFIPKAFTKWYRDKIDNDFHPYNVDEYGYHDRYHYNPYIDIYDYDKMCNNFIYGNIFCMIKEYMELLSMTSNRDIPPSTLYFINDRSFFSTFLYSYMMSKDFSNMDECVKIIEEFVSIVDNCVKVVAEFFLIEDGIFKKDCEKNNISLYDMITKIVSANMTIVPFMDDSMSIYMMNKENSNYMDPNVTNNYETHRFQNMLRYKFGILTQYIETIVNTMGVGKSLFGNIVLYKNYINTCDENLQYTVKFLEPDLNSKVLTVIIDNISKTQEE